MAQLVDAPVVLVVDGSAMSASVAAMVRGYRDHRADVTVAGVIVNRVGSDHHATLLREALTEIDMPVLGPSVATMPSPGGTATWAWFRSLNNPKRFRCS